MTVVSDQSPAQRQSSGENPEAEISLTGLVGTYRRDGAMGMLHSVGEAMQQNFDNLYSVENLSLMRDKILDSLPEELRQGLSQFFNMLSGQGQPEEPSQNHEYQMIGETFGTGRAESDSVRMGATFAQRDENSFASAVNIGSGSGGFIMELNGIQMGPDGKPLNGEEDDGVELMRETADEIEREQQERLRIQAWDEAPSSDYPGMTNAEALTILRRINGNLPFYSQLAVQRGLIKPEDEMAFQTYMRNKQWLMEQERAGKTDTPEYRERKRQQDEANERHPTFQRAEREIVAHAAERGFDNTTASPVSGAKGDSVAFAEAADTFANFETEGGPRSETAPISLAAGLDRTEGSFESATISEEFNSAANGDEVFQPAAAPQGTPTPTRVAIANFEPTGMI